MLAMGGDLAVETSRAVRGYWFGVEHRDVRPPNVLWNTEGPKVMLVDFERSEILNQVVISKCSKLRVQISQSGQ
jgi:serine/threonine protein kinase